MGVDNDNLQSEVNLNRIKFTVVIPLNPSRQKVGTSSSKEETR